MTKIGLNGHVRHGNYHRAINYLQYTVTKLTEVILYPLNFQLPSLLVAENRPATPMPIAHIGSEQQQQQNIHSLSNCSITVT